MVVRALEFYSGIGGLHLALSRSSVDAEIVQAFDWDQTACQAYIANYGDIVRKVDISTLAVPALAALNTDLWLLSPACQPYTVLNPDAKGALDPRAQSFLYLVQTVLPELASSNQHPSRLLVENVAGFETSSTRQILISSLRSIGYTTLELLLTPLQFGIPNSRLRYYLLAKKSPLQFQHVSSDHSGEIWRRIPGDEVIWSDPRLTDDLDVSTNEIREYLDTDHTITSQNFAIPDRILQKWGRLFDIVLPSSRRTCCFTRGYTQLVERAGSILQMNEELDTTTTFDNFLKAQSDGNVDAVKILHPLGLRYFSPSELLRIFAFDVPQASSPNSTFIWPPTLSTKSKYKLIGNSVNVKVVQALIEYLFCDVNAEG
ncbi:S-adenosyl-L-methionine-dependent methyltransferase [Crassisporium funariophilum]|nr:S-adenosyl-L-methionine-dependent methyltransferase [Crassisporium funariophilum]